MLDKPVHVFIYVSREHKIWNSNTALYCFWHRLPATYSARCHRVIIQIMTQTRMIRRWKLHGHIFRWALFGSYNKGRTMSGHLRAGVGGLGRMWTWGRDCPQLGVDNFNMALSADFKNCTDELCFHSVWQWCWLDIGTICPWWLLAILYRAHWQ